MSQEKEPVSPQYKNVSNLTAIIWLVVFFPVGLYLMWAKTNWNKIIKITVSVLITVLLLISLPQIGRDTKEVAAVNSTEDNTETSTTEITTETTTLLTTESITDPITGKITQTTKQPAMTSRSAQPTVYEAPKVKNTFTVLLNINTNRYHQNINCSAVKKMNEENKKYVEVSNIKEVVNMGYEPCGICSK